MSASARFVLRFNPKGLSQKVLDEGKIVGHNVLYNSLLKAMPMQTESLPLLYEARQRFTQRDLAAKLSVAPKTVARWERGETPCPKMLRLALQEILRFPSAQASPMPSRFTFIDLFAGIGGIRLGFESAGGQCIFTSEWNDWSRKTYIENHASDHPFVSPLQA